MADSKNYSSSKHRSSISDDDSRASASSRYAAEEIYHHRTADNKQRRKHMTTKAKQIMTVPLDLSDEERSPTRSSSIDAQDWKCRDCGSINKSEDTKCDTCDTPKPKHPLPQSPPNRARRNRSRSPSLTRNRSPSEENVYKRADPISSPPSAQKASSTDKNSHQSTKQTRPDPNRFSKQTSLEKSASGLSLDPNESEKKDTYGQARSAADRRARFSDGFSIVSSEERDDPNKTRSSSSKKDKRHRSRSSSDQDNERRSTGTTTTTERKSSATTSKNRSIIHAVQDSDQDEEAQLDDGDTFRKRNAKSETSSSDHRSDQCYSHVNRLYPKLDAETFSTNTTAKQRKRSPSPSTKELSILKNSFIAYIPDLPPNIENSQTLENMIRQCLERKHKQTIRDVKCFVQLGVGVVALHNKEDQDNLVKVIEKSIIDSSKNTTISFVDHINLTSYVVINTTNMKHLPTANDIAKQWQKLYKIYAEPRCEQVSVQFPNIFRIITLSLDDLFHAVRITDFSIDDHMATVYFQGDCCFFEDLPQSTNLDRIKAAIVTQISDRYMSKELIHIQYNKESANAVVITSGRARVWSSYSSINLDGRLVMKKDSLACRLLSTKVPKGMPTSLICDHQVLPSARRVDDKVLSVGVCSHSKDPKDSEIDADTWYETEMADIKKPDIMQFISNPQHDIFRWKWNSKAFLDEFARWKSDGRHGKEKDQDEHENLCNLRRHALRMTVMLNTIGVVKRGFYRIGEKEIKIKPDRLKTVVYNHKSKVKRGKTIPLVEATETLYPSTIVKVVNEDCLIVYKNLVREGYQPVLLNMANANTAGGGYKRGDGAQEETLFRRSNYYQSLDKTLDDDKPSARFYCDSNCELEELSDRDELYPMDEFGAIYTFGLTVFRLPEEQGYSYMDVPMYDVCAIAMAAYRDPQIEKKDFLAPKFSIGTRKKIENIFSIAYQHKHDCLVLSALGCGAFRNPPTHVANIFKSVIEQFAGYFKCIYFSIIDDHNTGQDFNRDGNFRPFRKVFDNSTVIPKQHRTVDMMVGPWRILNQTTNEEVVLGDVRICYLYPCQYGGKCKDIRNAEHCRKYSHPSLCPYTDSPISCKEKDDDQHLLWYRHRQQCCYGGECELTATNPSHAAEFEHPGVADIRRLCGNLAHKCNDRQNLEHIIQYRHQGNDDRSSVIRYLGQNRTINFMKNQENMIKAIKEHTKNWKPISASNLSRVENLVKSFQPVHRCNKVIFELILLHSHVMSRGYMENLKIPSFVAQAVREHKHVRDILDRYAGANIDEQVKEFTEVIVSHAYSSKYNATVVATTHSSPVMSGSYEDHEETKRRNERSLKALMKREELDAIEECTREFAEASWNLHISPPDIGHPFDKVLGADKYVFSTLGPNLGHYYGDIFLVFKSELMLHPDASFSPQAATSFNSGGAFRYRRWATDPGAPADRMKCFHESKLHASIPGYEHAAALELIAVTGSTEKSMDVDVEDVFSRWTNVDSHEVFAAYLPKLIPLDYIEEIYMTKNLFASLTKTAQKAAKKIFGDSLHITNHDINLIDMDSNRFRPADKSRSEYQDYVTKQLIEKFQGQIERPRNFFGTMITLAPSCFSDHIVLPSTISNTYRHSSDPDDTYIYWQTMSGDMMITLSKEQIDSNADRTNLPCLVCYIAKYPSLTTQTYNEDYSYLNVGDPSRHEMIMKDGRCSAKSQTFHRGCNLDDYMTYCLKLQMKTGEVTLSHAGSNGIYCYEKITCSFAKTTLNLTELKYIHVSAGSQKVPIRNFVVTREPFLELHPSIDKNYKQDVDTSSPVVKRPPAYDREKSSEAKVSSEEKPSLLNKIVNYVADDFTHGSDDESLLPCPFSVNCLLQDSPKHMAEKSHPCPYSELCPNKDKEPYLTHEKHRADPCPLKSSCQRLDDPFHRAKFRHEGYPDFLIPCRNGADCKNKDSDHRIKYSHGERILVERGEIPNQRADASPAAAAAAENISSNDEEKEFDDRERDASKIVCRYGTDCRNQNDSSHCSKYSHPREYGRRVSDDASEEQKPCRYGSDCRHQRDKDHCLKYSHPDERGSKASGDVKDGRTPCRYGNVCRSQNDSHHCLKYSHPQRSAPNGSGSAKDGRTQCRHGKWCHDQNDAHHCSKYSHP